LFQKRNIIIISHPADAQKSVWCIKIMSGGNASSGAGVNKVIAPFRYGVKEPHMNRTARATYSRIHKGIIGMGMKMLELSEITVS
jgi:hypothetical protein